MTRIVAFPLAALLTLIGVPRGPGERILFTDVAEGSGLHFSHDNGAAGRYHLPEIMGAGGALFDYDGDGDLDVLLLQDQSLEGEHGRGGPRLYRNDLAPSSATPPRLRFTDVTDRAGFVVGDYTMGVAAGDYDNDGDVDLYVTSFGANRLYRNNGDGTFADVTHAAGSGLDDPRWSTSASFTDYDGDGALDLFVTNYLDFAVPGSKRCSDPTGAADYCGPLQFRPVPDRLFRNNGHGGFVDVSDAAGINAAYGSGLGVVGADFTGDGRADFYVANDGRPNQLWVNQGDGTFKDDALVAGVAVNMDGQPEGSMGIAAGDPDDDGDLDLFVTNITNESHAFYVNDGRGQFQDRRIPAGLASATLRSTGFGTDWFDYDTDGRLDLFVANGAVTILEVLRGDPFPFRQPNQLLHNLDGRRFRDVSGEAGPSFRLSEVSRGAAFGDVDNDGDVDVLVTNNGGPVRLLLNQSPPGRHWIELRLQGTSGNRQGLGAHVGVTDSTGTTRWRDAHSDGSYLSASDPRLHFGLNAAGGPVRIVVQWPGGSREVWEDVRPDRLVTLTQGAGAPYPVSKR